MNGAKGSSATIRRLEVQRLGWLAWSYHCEVEDGSGWSRSWGYTRTFRSAAIAATDWCAETKRLAESVEPTT